jgi:hypothetical protein
MTTDFALAVQTKFGVSYKKVVKLVHSLKKIISSSTLFSQEFMHAAKCEVGEQSHLTAKS